MKGLSAEELVAVVAFLNAAGWSIKQSPIKNWMIPHILALLGAVVCPFLGDVSSVKDVAWLAITGVTQGLAAVGLNQAFRQSSQGRLEDNGPITTTTTNPQPKP